MENKTALGLRAFAERIFLVKVHAKAFKVVRHETDGKNLPTHVLIEMTADNGLSPVNLFIGGVCLGAALMQIAVRRF